MLTGRKKQNNCMTKHINKLDATLTPTARDKTERQMCGN